MSRQQDFLDLLKSKAMGNTVVAINTIELGKEFWPNSNNGSTMAAGLLKSLEEKGVLKLTRDSYRKYVAAEFTGREIPHRADVTSGTVRNALETNCKTFRMLYLGAQRENPEGTHKSWLATAKAKFYEKVESGNWRYIVGARQGEWSDGQLLMWLSGYITNSERVSKNRTFENISPPRSDSGTARKPRVVADKSAVPSHSQLVAISNMINTGISKIDSRISTVDNMLTEVLRQMRDINERAKKVDRLLNELGGEATPATATEDHQEVYYRASSPQ